MDNKTSKLIYIASMLIFGSIGLFVRNISMPSLHIAFIRSFVGTAVMMIIYLVLKRKLDRKAIMVNRYNLLFAGTFLGINWILLFEAYKRTTITSATLAYYMAPIIFIILSSLFLKTRLTAIRIMTILVAFFGLVTLQMKDMEIIYSEMHTEGIGFGLAAAFFYALVIIFNRKMEKIGGMDRTFMELLLSLLVLGLYMAVIGDFADFEVPRSAVFYALFLGVIHTGLAYYLYFSTVDKLDSQHVALFSYIDPLSAILFSVAFLGETIYLNLGVGALLILGSSVLFDLIGQKEKLRS